MSAAAPVRVEVDGLSRRFVHRVKGEVYAARDVTLDVAPGEFLTLLGPSGCGKTTTLRMIAGFEKPDAGRVRFSGEDVTYLPANQRNIGFVFQNYALFPHLCVAENVSYGLEMRSIPAAEIKTRVAEVLALVGLAGYEQQFSSQLSGGEQQRVALARAIVIQPRVLLFDEPLSNLDAKLRVQMRHEIRELQQRLGITTLYVTHDQEEAMAVSDRIVVMSQGSVLAQGSAHDLYHRPGSEFVARFIGRVNLVPAWVVEVRGDTARVEALGAVMEVAAVGAVAAGDEVRLVLRPEAIEVVRGEGPPSLVGEGRGEDPPSPLGEGRGGGRSARHWTAKVASRVFLGEKIEYRLDVAGISILVVRYNAGPAETLAEGSTVGLRVIEGAASLLPGEGG
ncbi:MAG: ABC transporter ATP-binding protein [Usitatibacter sp.]